jgi:hypothetical protein
LTYSEHVQEDEVDYSERRDSRRFQEQLEAEERAERKILSAKKVFLVVAFHVHQPMALFLL